MKTLVRWHRSGSAHGDHPPSSSSALADLLVAKEPTSAASPSLTVANPHVGS